MFCVGFAMAVFVNWKTKRLAMNILDARDMRYFVRDLLLSSFSMVFTMLEASLMFFLISVLSSVPVWKPALKLYSRISAKVCAESAEILCLVRVGASSAGVKDAELMSSRMVRYSRSAAAILSCDLTELMEFNAIDAAVRCR